MEKYRLEAFSDDVSAIVIRFLSLEIHFPEVDYSQIKEIFVSLLPRFLVYGRYAHPSPVGEGSFVR